MKSGVNFINKAFMSADPKKMKVKLAKKMKNSLLAKKKKVL
jgi:hypothetical protein